jgi:1-acyl-sn-glycerol-3-phosphate acyltransferase
MVRTFVSIYRLLAAHRRWAAVGLLAIVAVAVVLALRIDYEEDIAKFLPSNPEQEACQAAVEQLSSQNRIVVVFRGSSADSVKQAMDSFEEHFAAVDTLHTVNSLQVTVDETQMIDMLAFVSANAPYFLTAADYERMDSLLADSQYIDRQLVQVKQQLLLPTGVIATQTLSRDPLQLFAPVMERLQRSGRNSRFEVDEGYVFVRGATGSDGGAIGSNGAGGNSSETAVLHGLAFLTSPYGTSESAHNAELAALVDEAMTRTMTANPGVNISAVGGPLIAVSNATQIKHDSLLAVSVAVVIILALLLWHYRRLSDLLWITASLAFGWLVALACMSIIRGSISIIVLGIGSVIIGIAANYPLHYLDHLKETGDRLQTLRDMVPPLLIGNITTVSAFLCLVWLDAAAMRDLGLFGALMLVATILFVLVVLPLWVKPQACRHKTETMHEAGKRLAAVRIPYLPLLILAVTLVLGYFSLQTSFDADLRNINYMTDGQRRDMKLLAALSEDMSDEMVQMIPSATMQQQRIQLWNDFRQRHPQLADSLKAESRQQGFSATAFEPFELLLAADLQPRPAGYFEPVGQFLGGQHLLNAKNIGFELVAILSDSFNYVSFVCGFVVFVFLWLSFRRIELAMMAFLPLAVGWIWILGLMQLFSVQFNIVNIILATFIFGQGDDYTIFITEGLVYEYTTGRQRLRSYRRSVILSAVIMFVGIGTLIMAKHPALRSLAEVTIIGMGTVVVMAYYLPPLMFRWLTRKNKEGKLPITLRRVAYSLFAMGFFLSFMYLFLLPYTWIFFHVGKVTEERRMRYHQMLQRLANFVIHRVPGVKFYMENRVGENFEKPAIIVSNHQSHLDLMCLLMLTPRIVFLTNEWVWNNPFYGMVIHRAEYYPVNSGIENHVEQLSNLYKRGYSICVFPEGTRSDDCSILRFHKGAFYLAQQLKADVLPIYLHGVGHVLPKRDFMLRQGRIDMEVGRRMTTPLTPTANGQEPPDLLDFTRKMRHHYQEHYRQMCERLETPEYWAPYRRLEQYYKIDLT